MPSPQVEAQHTPGEAAPESGHGGKGGTVVVMGGSVAGVLAAAALAPSPAVRKVLVLDRDADPAKAAAAGGPVQGRKGTPHDLQIHAILCSGRDNVEQLLPGFTDRFVEAGAMRCGRMRDYNWCHVGGWLPNVDDHTYMYLGSRPALDRAVRAGLRDRFGDKVEVRWGTAVVGLEFTPDADAVTGVRLEDGTVIEADLVVDALGSNSPVVKWVVKHGYEEPPTLEYTMDIGYSTTHFMLPPKSDPARKNFKGMGCFVFHRPDEGFNRGSCVFTLHPNALPGGVPDPTREYALACNYGFGSQRPSCTNVEEWLDFAGSAASPAVRDYLQGATLVSPLFPFTRQKQTWRRFDKVASWPDRLVSVGDSVATLNPTYGQGMTVASYMALQLRKDADALLQGTTLPTQQAAASLVWVAFLLNAAEDTKMESTKGLALPGLFIAHMGTTAYARAASSSPLVAEALLRVAHLQASPLELMHPAVLVRVIWFTLLAWGARLLRALQGVKGVRS